MDLPPDLRQALETLLVGTSSAELQRAGRVLSERYRGEVLDGRAHLSSALSAKAYLVARMPATYAAVRHVMERIAERRPEFTPKSQLDVGAGPGTATFAAVDRFPSLRDAVLVEASAPIRAVGEKLVEAALPFVPRWIAAGAATAELAASDLVTLAYVLDEMDASAGDRLVRRLWAATRQILVIVEPGTPAGWRRILSARSTLLAEGAVIVAPCPHDAACPLREPDWCHFAQRLARSRAHRLAKGGEAPFEDEKFSYLVVARDAGEQAGSRVLAMPRVASGKAQLKLCRPDGTACMRLVTKREGEAFRQARRSTWGDELDVA